MKKRIIFCITALCMLAGCKDEPMSLFDGDDAIAFTYLLGEEQDSINYSFKFNPVVKERDTIWLKMRLIGKLSDRPRKISIATGPGTTAQPGSHYILPEYELPAGQYLVNYPLVIVNAKDLSDKTVRLVLQVQDSDDLKIGTKGSPDRSTQSTTTFTINFSGDLVKPDYWDYISFYIGEYSKVRYQFMIDEFGSSDFRPNTKGGIIAYPQWLNIRVRLSNALDAYVKLHGNLIDENGAIVRFPQ